MIYKKTQKQLSFSLLWIWISNSCEKNTKVIFFFQFFPSRSPPEKSSSQILNSCSSLLLKPSFDCVTLSQFLGFSTAFKIVEIILDLHKTLSSSTTKSLSFLVSLNLDHSCIRKYEHCAEYPGSWWSICASSGGRGELITKAWIWGRPNYN